MFVLLVEIIKGSMIMYLYIENYVIRILYQYVIAQWEIKKNYSCLIEHSNATFSLFDLHFNIFIFHKKC